MAISGCHSFFQGESYIRQHRAPLAMYPLRTTLGAGYHFLVGMAIVLAATAFLSGVHDAIVLLALVPSLVLLFLFAWSLAVCTSTFNVLFHDTQHLLEIALQILFYLTPIIYEPKILIQRNLGWAVRFNPFAVLLDLLRQPLLKGTLPAYETVSGKPVDRDGYHRRGGDPAPLVRAAVGLFPCDARIFRRGGRCN